MTVSVKTVLLFQYLEMVTGLNLIKRYKKRGEILNDLQKLDFWSNFLGYYRLLLFFVMIISITDNTFPCYSLKDGRISDFLILLFKFFIKIIYTIYHEILLIHFLFFDKIDKTTFIIKN